MDACNLEVDPADLGSVSLSYGSRRHQAALTGDQLYSAGHV